MLYQKHEAGAAACFTFGIGKHYLQQAHQGHAALLLGVLDGVLKADRRLQVSSPSPLVEVNHRADRAGQFEWVSLYNHSGQRGNALHAPIPIGGIEIRLAPRSPVKAVRSLVSGHALETTSDSDGRVCVTLAELDHYEMVVFEY